MIRLYSLPQAKGLQMNQSSSIDYNWCNNAIGAKLNKDYPRDFSLCDIDGLVRKEYVSSSKHYTRMIIYESKHENEKIGTSQLKSLTTLSASIRWENFDNYSGVFILRHDEELNDVIVYKIHENDWQRRGEISFETLYAWFSALDKK